jgi:hypothetical protein
VPFLLPGDSESVLGSTHFTTAPFLPVIQANHSLNEMCSFRIEIPVDPIENSMFFFKSKERNIVSVEVELLMYGLSSPEMKKKFPADAEGFSKICSTSLYLDKIWNGIHEYTEVNFHNLVFCSASLIIHADLFNFEIDKKKAKESKGIVSFLFFCFFLLIF